MSTRVTAPITTKTWYMQAASFSWRAPFVAFLVVIVANIVVMSLDIPKSPAREFDFFFATLWLAGAILAAGIVCSVVSMIAATVKRHFSSVAVAVTGLLLNGGVVYCLSCI